MLELHWLHYEAPPQNGGQSGDGGTKVRPREFGSQKQHCDVSCFPVTFLSETTALESLNFTSFSSAIESPQKSINLCAFK